MIRTKRLLFILVVLGALWPSVAPAREGRGRIEGRVVLEDGRPVATVAVSAGEISQIVHTDERGLFTLTRLPPGTYELTFTFLEQSVTRTGVVVEVGTVTSVEQTVAWEVGIFETVTVRSAARREEPIMEASAGVTRISEEQIEQQAAHGQLPKLLEFTPGVEIIQNGLYDFNFNARGFNDTLTRRVEVRLDGRDLSQAAFITQWWWFNSFPLDDLSSVEFLRGPSSALYGANAWSGVMILTSKEPRDSQGGQVRLTAGELDTTHVDFRWAGELGNGWYMKAIGGVRDSEDFAVPRVGSVEYSVPCTVFGQPDCLREERVSFDSDIDISFGSLRVDKYLKNGSLFTLEGGLNDSDGLVHLNGVGRSVVEGEQPWGRFGFTSRHWNVLAHHVDNQTVALSLNTGLPLVVDSDHTQLEFRTNWDFADNKVQLVAGAVYDERSADSLNPSTGMQTIFREPVDYDREAAFAQVDWRVNEHLKLVGAARWEDSTFHDPEVSPKAAVIYNINPKHTLRFTYKQAFRENDFTGAFLQVQVAMPEDLSPLNDICLMDPNGPFDCELGETPILAVGNESLEIEENQTFEIGYTGILGRKAFLTVDFYRSYNDNFITTNLLPQVGTPLGRLNEDFGPWEAPSGVPDDVRDAVRAAAESIFLPLGTELSNTSDGSTALVALSFTNFGEVDTKGVDLGLTYFFTDKWKLSFTYSWFDFEIKESQGFDDLLAPNTPEHKASSGLAYANKRLDASFSLRWVEDFRWIGGRNVGDVESYTVADLHANYRLAEHWKVGLNVANLFDDEHWELWAGNLVRRRALVHVTYSW